MVASFRLETTGARQIEARLGALVDSFGDLTPLMEGFGNTLEGFVLEAFETETAPDGTPWKPSLRKKLEGGKTLTKSGQLRDSRTHVTALWLVCAIVFTALDLWPAFDRWRDEKVRRP